MNVKIRQSIFEYICISAATISFSYVRLTLGERSKRSGICQFIETVHERITSENGMESKERFVSLDL
jgi:hypothetical protein